MSKAEEDTREGTAEGARRCGIHRAGEGAGGGGGEETVWEEVNCVATAGATSGLPLHVYVSYRLYYALLGCVSIPFLLRLLPLHCSGA